MDNLTKLKELDAQIAEMAAEMSRLYEARKALVAEIARGTVTLASPLIDIIDELPPRAWGPLHIAGIKTLHEVDALSDAELLIHPGFGRRTLYQLRDLIEEIKFRQPA
jgi:hypothetical protein